MKTSKKWLSIIVGLSAPLCSLSVAHADLAPIKGEIDSNDMVVSGVDAWKGLAGSLIADDPTYEPIQQYLPKPTHYYARTIACSTDSTTGNCDPQGCQTNNNPGVTHMLLTKPIDEEEPDGTGNIIQPDDAKTLAQWDKNGTYCSSVLPEAKGAVLSEVLDFDAEDLSQHGLLAAKVNGPKNNGLTLIEYNTNIWAEPQDQTINTRILDVPVTARATAEEFVFDYGDGSPKVTRDVPGHYLSDDEWDVETDTTHVYEETGTFQANVMTVYEAEFSVNGGEWLPMTGRAEVWGDPVPVDVWRTDTYLVNGRK